MPPSSQSHPHPGPGSSGPPAGPRLCSTERAAAAAVEVIGADPHLVAAITLDADRVPTGVVSLRCAAHHDHELDVLDAAVGAPLVVLASGRSRIDVPPPDGTWWRWDHLLVRAEEAGTVLLDWFLVGSGVVVSMAEMDGVPESRWWPLGPGPGGPEHPQRRLP